MRISRVEHSRINEVDFSNLKFGTVFSDHMYKCKYTAGVWRDPEIIPYGPLNLNPGTQVLHYAQSVFEGLKAFKNENDDLFLFRVEDNFNRLNQSAIRLSIPELPRDLFFDGLNKLLNLDKNWCKSTIGSSLYIRPFIFASSECIKASSANEFTFLIITSPCTTYYSGEMHVVVEQYFSRAASGGVGYAKASGNYAASFFPTIKANRKGFTQIIWTDSKTHKYIEESGTMNIWFVIDNKLVTPELNDSILAGITRDSIISISKKYGIEFVERKISVDEILAFSKNGKLTEAFGTGTAVTVTPINSITMGENIINLNSGKTQYAKFLKKKLQEIQNGKVEDFSMWNYKVL
tara:strand:+ start:43 stop:1089 length:1047 start_codon:yes stop_codon:yes gene_type:complete